jgi:hypothetical protein
LCKAKKKGSSDKWIGDDSGPFSSRFESTLPPLLGANPERRQSEPKVEVTVCCNYTQKNKNKGAAFEKKTILILSISAQRASQNVFFDGCQKRKHG